MQSDSKTVLAALVAALCACTSPGPRAVEPTAPLELDREGAARYLASLVQVERRAIGLPELTWDESAATATRAHVDDMASHGFAAHIGTDGSVPEERASRAGVGQAVMENVGCLADGVARPLVTAPRFSRAEVEAIHAAFMNEKPPFDGHRRNVLSPHHGGIGVSVARVEGASRPCVAVLLVARDGELAALPQEAVLGNLLEVSGTVAPPSVARYVSSARLPPRGRPSPNELNRTLGYAPPRPHVAVEVELDPTTPGRFHAHVPLGEDRTPGVYAIGLWAQLVDEKDPVLVGLRTLVVR